MSENPEIPYVKLFFGESPFVIPNFKNFCNYLYDRIHLQLRYQELLQYQFTIFLILRDRSNKDTVNQHLIYAGLEKQQEHLTPYNPDPCTTWKTMRGTSINIGNLPVTKSIATKYKDNTLSIGHLLELKVLNENYFMNSREKWPQTREAEYGSIEHYFPQTEELYFLSLPVFLFGEFEGVAQIVFHENDIDKDENGQTTTYFRENIRPRLMKQIVRIFTREYENLLWNWQPPLGTKGYTIRDRRKYDEFKSKLFLNAPKNIEERDKTILKELGYIEFYQESKQYYEWRISENKNHIKAYIHEHENRAVMAILLDSFAHNVSAHSLTVLKWIFQQKIIRDADISSEMERINIPEREEQLKSWTQLAQAPADEFLKSIAEIIQRWKMQAQLSNDDNPILPLRHQIRQPNDELTQLLRYLTEKGAFWSGIGRNEQFGGEMHNLYDLLYNDFANNPFFLGTIAYSEGISKINLHIKVYSQRNHSLRTDGQEKDALLRTYELEQNAAGEFLSGQLARIDMGQKDSPHYEHQFFQEGMDHALLMPVLEETQVYLPGGVVGKHAFFTLIENTLRDVKHFSRKERDKMGKNGLDLVISVFPSKLTRKVRAGHYQYDLYKIGIWIKASQSLQVKDKGPLGAVSLRRIIKPIIDPNQNARLGGSQQDKICAAMLMTGRFDQVEDRENEFAEAYFPWVRFAHHYPLQQQAGETGVEEEYEFRAGTNDRLPGKSQQEIKQLPQEPGYLKKYIHLWRSNLVYSPKKKQRELTSVDLNRHHLMLVDGRTQFAKLRQQGVIRVLESNSDPKDVDRIYGQWLQVWMGQSHCIIDLKIGRSICGYILIEDGNYHYYNKKVYRDMGRKFRLKHANYPRAAVTFEHGESNRQDAPGQFLRLRSHSALRTKFFKDIQDISKFSQGTLEPFKACELAEVLLSKICIFDDRMAQRLDVAKNRKVLSEQLRLDVFPEDEKHWEEVKEKGILQYNFVVFHISYLRQIKKANGEAYLETDIVEFIQNEIVQGEQVPDNFVFIITSGRGRLTWWDKLSEAMQEDPLAYHYTTFRQSESLINAIEDGMQLEDDFQIKYNLAKVLFGS